MSNSGAAVRAGEPVGHSQAGRSAANRLRVFDATAPDATGPAVSAPVYLLVVAALAALLLGAIAAVNHSLAPLMHSESAKAAVGEALAAGTDQAVFDLNIDMRGIRRAQIAAISATPQVVILGASHWQEAPHDLFPGKSFLNAHVHRDYYEDLLAAAELLVRHGRLPEMLLMGIREQTYSPPSARTDSLWRDFAPEYRAMAARLGIPAHPVLAMLPTERWRDLFSLKTLWAHATRFLTAPDRPGSALQPLNDTLDILSHDGSIRWSRKHAALFTPERTRAVALAAAEQKRDRAPLIDPAAVEAVQRLVAFLVGQGVRVVLVHPPLNPAFYDAVADDAYGVGMRRVEAVTAAIARATGAGVAGSFDPHRIGCREEMYIDSEHSNAGCLAMLLGGIPES